MAQRQILVTSALPYANGAIHLGHLVEHIQTDIFVRALRMQGHTVHAICADDTHGTPVMLRAEKEGVKPEDFIARVRSEHMADFEAFGIHYDRYGSTHDEGNRALTASIYLTLRERGHVETRDVEQFFDPQREMFLPDRYVKGECPKCGAKDQYGDGCEVCGSTYVPTDLKNPFSVVSGATPVRRNSTHYFVRLADFEAELRQWLAARKADGGVQSEVVNKLEEWFKDGLRSWDISRDAPYFGFEIPDAPGKYFYVWLDAPIGYLSTFKAWCESAEGQAAGLTPADFERYTRPSGERETEMIHFIGKDIIYFHTLFWPAMLHGAGYRKPSAVNVHGFLTVDGAKMSKARGTFINASTYREHLAPEFLRYFLASQLGPTLADVDLDLKAFEDRVNSHLVGKFVNIASRCAGFVHKFFEGRLAEQLGAEAQAFYATQRARLKAVPEHYARREYAAALREIMDVADAVNALIAERAPWVMAKDEARRGELHELCSLALNLFRLLAVHLKPVLPFTADKAAAFLQSPIQHFSDADAPLLAHTIAPFEPLLTRVDPKAVTAMLEASKSTLTATVDPAPAEAPKLEPIAAPIGIEDFSKLDLRVGKVLVCEFVEGSDKLLRFVLDMGDHQRQIFSGIRAAYAEPEKLVGRNVVVIANLAPRKMRFGVSEGMILSAGTGGADLFLLDADAGVKPGMQVR